MIKAIFFDIDGTLLHSQTGTISEQTLAALHQLKEKGIKIFISSGRGQGQLFFLDGLITFDGYVTLNGQLCYHDDVIIYKNSIAAEDLKVIVEQAKNQLYPCFFIEQNRMYANLHNDLVSRLCNEIYLKVPPVENPDRALVHDVYQLWAFLEPGYEHIILDQTKKVAATRWHDRVLDIVPSGGNKARGIEQMLNYYGISPAETMAFGDGINDIEMIRFVRHGIAMGNAVTKLKEYAEYVTEDADQDGIVSALKHYQLI